MSYVGEGVVPWDIMRRRKLTLETMKRMGTPVLIKHRYNADDVAKGIARRSPNWAPEYKEVRRNDPLSNGVGFASVEVAENEWYDEEGELHIAETPEEGWQLAPLYRGYGPGYLTYCVLPDAPEDVFRLTPQGALLHTQVARLQLPWWPLCGDNDLLITCELDPQQKIIQTFERYQLKQVTPITMRGLDRSGQREFRADAASNRFWVGQQAEANKFPLTEEDPIFQVEVDR